VSPPGQADHNSSMMRVMPDGAGIACRRHGDGPGTVLVHGGFLDSRSWAGLMEVLARTRTVVGSRPARARGQRSLCEFVPAFG
jgi:pimeloyl-ACP methyl ester carboxylesterase